MIAIADHRRVEREQRAGVVGDDQRRGRATGRCSTPSAWTRHQTLVEELEERDRRPRRTPRRSPTRPRGTRPQPPAHPLDRPAQRPRQRGGRLARPRPADRGPSSSPPRSRRRKSRAPPRGRPAGSSGAALAHGPTAAEPARDARPGCGDGNEAPAAPALATKSRDRRLGVVARREADLLASAASLSTAAPVAQQADPVAVAGRRRRAGGRAGRGPRPNERDAGSAPSAGRARRRIRVSEIVPSGATLTGPRTGLRTAAASAPVASSAWISCSRGSKPSCIGTTGSVR